MHIARCRLQLSVRGKGKESKGMGFFSGRTDVFLTDRGKDSELEVKIEDT